MLLKKEATLPPQEAIEISPSELGRAFIRGFWKHYRWAILPSLILIAAWLVGMAVFALQPESTNAAGQIKPDPCVSQYGEAKRMCLIEEGRYPAE